MNEFLTKYIKPKEYIDKQLHNKKAILRKLYFQDMGILSYQKEQ